MSLGNGSKSCFASVYAVMRSSEKERCGSKQDADPNFVALQLSRPLTRPEGFSICGKNGVGEGCIELTSFKLSATQFLLPPGQLL